MTSSKPLITDDLQFGIFERTQVELGYSPEASAEIAHLAMAVVLEHLVGNQVYFPRAALLRHKHCEIYLRATGCNTAQLAAEYGYHPGHIHRIVRQVRGRKGKP